jgi:tetratricopeptide (TPR) repeat protein
MQSVARINRFWTRRLAAGGALTLLMSGLLTAVGLGMVVVAVAVAVLVVVAAGVAARAVHAYGPGARRRGLRIAASMRRRSAIALAQTRTRVAAGGRAGAEQASRARRRLVTSAHATTTRARERAATWMVEHAQSRAPTEEPPAIDLHREALRLNGAGTRQRRNGALVDAIALHRRALQILEVLDDRRTLALTQNNLALALSQVGDDERAVALFEQAAATLHELGEEEHEGQIIANLGLAHRRYGRYEESADVLQLALEKLPPASRAYATVEAELKRAS